MVAEKIISSLPYMGTRTLIADAQNVDDIIAAIKASHKIDSADYDLFAPMLIGKNVQQTANNIFKFLKSNTRYYMEPGEMQTVKSPGAILREKNIDCKNYALFAGGVLDAINRTGLQNIPFVYRFVSHSLFNDDYNHVFIVINPGSANEIFIDPIPEHKNIYDRTPYYSSTDKKISGMALYRVSGYNSAKIGFIDPVTLAALSEGLRNIGQLFSKRPNPNDWKRWQVGDAIHWSLNDGDSVPNEAHNIQQYLQNNLNNQQVLSAFWSQVTPAQLTAKFQRAGAGGSATDFSQILNNRQTPRNLPGGGSMNIPGMPNQTTQAGSNMLLTLLLVGAGIFAISKMKK